MVIRIPATATAMASVAQGLPKASCAPAIVAATRPILNRTPRILGAIGERKIQFPSGVPSKAIKSNCYSMAPINHSRAKGLRPPEQREG